MDIRDGQQWLVLLARLRSELPGLLDGADVEQHTAFLQSVDQLTQALAQGNAAGEQTTPLIVPILQLFITQPRVHQRMLELQRQMDEMSAKGLVTRGSSELFGDPLSTAATVWYECPGEGTPHRLAREEVVRRPESPAPYCPIHIGVRVNLGQKG